MERIRKLQSAMPATLAAQALPRLLIGPELRAMLQYSGSPQRQWRMDDPQLAYRETPAAEREISGDYPNVHHGQVKLLLNEVEFLTRCIQEMPERKPLVIYAGSADGNHIVLLAQMFPELQFDLWDPRQFADELVRFATGSAGSGQQHNGTNASQGNNSARRSIPTIDSTYLQRRRSESQVKLINAYFLEEDAKNYARSYEHCRGELDVAPVFMSDIRRAPSAEEYGGENKQFMAQKFKLKNEDHEMQREWVVALRPWRTMLKFSPQYGEGTITYFAGPIYSQPYMGSRSTEARLIVDNVDAVQDIDTAVFESIAAYHNCVARPVFVGMNALDLQVCGLIARASKPLSTQWMPLLGPGMRYDEWRAFIIMREFVLMRMGSPAGASADEINDTAAKLLGRMNYLGPLARKFVGRQMIGIKKQQL